LSSDSRSPDNPVGYIDVEVVEAANLAAADFSGKSDPYVVLVNGEFANFFRLKQRFDIRSQSYDYATSSLLRSEIKIFSSMYFKKRSGLLQRSALAL
jgi:hypothetical protein